MKVTIIPIVISAFGIVNNRLLRRRDVLEVGMTGGVHPNHSISENGQNTKKGHGDLRILAVTENPYHQLKLMWKTRISKKLI